MTGNPNIAVRFVLPYEDCNDIKDKNKKPYIARKSASIEVIYNNELFVISNPQNYCYDGATIPFGIAKSNMKLLIPALFHDIICENKNFVKYNRKLSSLIFKELLVQCNVNKILALILYTTVDIYQRFQKGWLK